MIKKLITAILCAAFILTASGAAFAQSMQLNVEMNVFTVKVSGTVGTYAKRISVQMLNKEKTIPMYTGETDVVQNGTEYTFQFDDFNISENTLTCEYIIRVGGKNIPITEQSVNFINKNDRRNALTALNITEIDKIKEALTVNSATLELNITQYLSLNPEWQGRIDEIIAGLDLSINAQETNVIEKQQLLQAVFNENVEAANICAQTDAAKLAGLLDNSIKLALDKETYYKELKQANSLNTAISKFVSYNFEEVNGINKELINKVFDGCVLIGVLDRFDWGKAEEALKYYESKSLLSLNYSSFNKLDSSTKATVYKELKKVNFDDYAQIPAAFKRISDSYLPSSGGSGGGGGGSNGGSTVISGNPQDTVSTPAPQHQSFSDLAGASWAKESVDYFSSKGVINGKGDGRFYPNDSVTREEFVKIIVLAFDLLDESANAEFNDAGKTEWYYPYIASAKKAGIIAGINESEFGVGEIIIRQDMAVIMSRIFSMAGAAEAANNSEQFNDFGSVEDYAKESVKKLSAAGIIGGTGNGNFSPNENVTRAQSAKIAYELLKYIGGIA